MSYRAGFVGLIGLPNSGKSTLMNALVGEKISIVSAKPQTTRRRVLGVLSEKEFQAVFVDAPGVVSAQAGLNAFLRDEAQDVIGQSDVLIAVLNIDETDFARLEEIINLVRESGKPWIALINKTDLPQLHRPQILRERLTALGAVVIQGSARTAPEALRASVLEKVTALVPECAAPLYDVELFTLSTTREITTEIIREKCFEALHQEVPYGLAVRVLLFDESDPILKIHAEVYVAKENHRPIVIGQNAQTLKKIGTDARKEIEKLTGQRTFLDLKVVHKRNWQKNPGVMRNLAMSSLRLKRVALVGRPNVGKSTLFNRLTRSRKAVVKDQPGVTRDIQIETTEWWGKTFEVVDTGGLSEDRRGFNPLIRQQVVEFLGSVDLALLIVDGRAGIVPEDRLAFRTLKNSGVPFLVVVNKCDRITTAESYLPDFYEFGADLMPAAFERDFNIDEVVEWILARIGDEIVPPREGFRLAIIGKPNAGKSSLANCLLGEQRMLVSEWAGTTVDAVEAAFEFRGREYLLVDTAGLRSRGKQKDGVEVLSSFKSRDALFKADLILLVIDGPVGPSHQDSRLIEMCLDHHKPVIVVANKMDLGRERHEDFRRWFRDRVGREFHYFADVPVAFTSAKDGTGVNELFAKIEDLRGKLATKISTSKLNKFFTDVIKMAPAPVYGTTDVKFYYLTQTNQNPPSFIAFANHPEGVTPAYRRFLVRKIQENWGLKGIPLRIFVMEKGG